MFSALAPHSKGLTEQSLWSFDFENDMLDQANERDNEQLAEQLEKSIEFWQRVDATRGKA